MALGLEAEHIIVALLFLETDSDSCSVFLPVSKACYGERMR
jgi:hypothetical protein